jgi:hypothetical protein
MKLTILRPFPVSLYSRLVSNSVRAHRTIPAGIFLLPLYIILYYFPPYLHAWPLDILRGLLLNSLTCIYYVLRLI